MTRFECPHANPNCSVCKNNKRVQQLLLIELAYEGLRDKYLEVQRQIRCAYDTLNHINSWQWEEGVWEAKMQLKGKDYD